MKYTGQITIHTEMCCGSWPQFHDYRGRHGDKLEFWNWDYSINFGKSTKIKHLLIYDNDGVILYDNSWTYSRANTGSSGHYFPSPEEMSSKDWILLLSSDDYLNCEIETDEILEADKKKL